LYKAVFIDVDGTLIRKDHTISEDTFDTIQKLIEKNIYVILVSARPLSGIEPIAQKINLLTYPIASLNGSYICYNKTIIFNSVIDLNVTSKVYKILQPYKPTIIYYQQDKWFAEMPDFNTNHEQKITSVPLIFQSFENNIIQWQNERTGPNKILAIAAENIVKKLQRDLRKPLSESVNIDTSKPTYLEIINKPASKKNAVKFLIDHFNITIEETIAIGDNFNDKEMIAFAGMGIAMSNAPKEVKAVANYVTDTNDNDGVSKALRKFIIDA
jgi:Cof subfamily protein (haloacid dehalogenase superfamily)